MNRKSAAMFLTFLLTVIPTLFADKGGDKGRGGHHGGRDEEKFEKKVKIEDKHGRVRIEERERIRVRDDEKRVRIERRIRVRDDDDEDRVRVERRVRVQRPVVIVPANRIIIINNDVNRLESILATTQGTTVVFAQPTLVRFGNEAVVLANRIVVNTSALRRANAMSAARLLRMHIRQLRAAAARGDVVAVRLHAREALPFVVRIDGLV
jgi:hypothetical protein